MNLSNIKAFARVAKQTIVKHSPEILMGLGGVSFIATVVLACKETIEEQEILEVHETALEYVDMVYENEELDKKAWKKSRFNVYKDTSIETAKNYAPAVIVGGVSLTCFFGAFGIMRKRYATLMLAYGALEESFRKYRERVIEARGEDEDIYYLTGVKPKEITMKNDDGSKEKSKQLALPDGKIASPYVFKFAKYNEDGSRNQQWVNDRQLNLSYALGQQDWLNHQLYSRCVFDDEHRVKIRGSVMLNEARDLLGEVSNSTGSIVGWRFSNGEKNCNGMIKFRITEGMEPDPDNPDKMIPFLIIDPNCDGMIYDLLGEVEKKPFEPVFGDYGEDVSI